MCMCPGDFGFDATRRPPVQEPHKQELTQTSPRRFKELCANPLMLWQMLAKLLISELQLKFKCKEVRLTGKEAKASMPP